jgi:hypothetical protein
MSCGIRDDVQIMTSSLSFDIALMRRKHSHHSRLPTAIAMCPIIALSALVGCAAPTDVIDLRTAPQMTQDAMLQVKILPLGMPAPAGAGSVSPVAGYGCASTTEAASEAAVRQLRVKALRLHATAVADVLIGPAEGVICVGYNMIASGIAVAPRGLPSSY